MMTNPIQNIKMIGMSGLRMTLYNRSMIVTSLDETFTESGSQFNAIALEEYLFNKSTSKQEYLHDCAKFIRLAWKIHHHQQQNVDDATWGGIPLKLSTKEKLNHREILRIVAWQYSQFRVDTPESPASQEKDEYEEDIMRELEACVEYSEEMEKLNERLKDNKYLSKMQSNTQGVSDKGDEIPPEDIIDDEEDGSSDEVISDDKEREIQLMQKIAAWRAMFWKAKLLQSLASGFTDMPRDLSLPPSSTENQDRMELRKRKLQDPFERGLKSQKTLRMTEFSGIAPTSPTGFRDVGNTRKQLFER